MDMALIVVGLLMVGILIIWIFTYLSDPKQIGEDMETQVREAAPEELSRMDEEQRLKESNADDIASYSPGDSESE